MREQYIEQVKRSLTVSRKQRDAVIRDLQEAFASAMEHGETEQQVIERFGNPSDFADSIHEQFGINRFEKQRQKKKYQAGIAFIAAAAAFAAGISIKAFRLPDDVIGQADAMTHIAINGTAIDPFLVFMAGGAVMLTAAVLLMVRCCRRK